MRRHSRSWSAKVKKSEVDLLNCTAELYEKAMTRAFGMAAGMASKGQLKPVVSSIHVLA